MSTTPAINPCHGEITKKPQIFSKIRGDIREWIFIAGVIDTGDKLFAGVNDTAYKLFSGVNDTGD